MNLHVLREFSARPAGSTANKVVTNSRTFSRALIALAAIEMLAL